MKEISILSTVGKTNLYRLAVLEKYLGLKANIYAKVESTNPSGSIKDRVAVTGLVHAFADMKLTEKGEEVVEATSGNMGISLAFACGCFNHPCHIFMPKSASIERRKIMEAYGAKVELVDGVMADAVKAAEEYCKEHPDAFYFDQFNNPAAVEAHLKTGDDIIKDLTYEDGEIDFPHYLIAGIGTGATITGVAKRLVEVAKEKGKDKPIIIGVESENSPLLTKGYSGKHKLQGLGPNFVPSILDLSYIDSVVDVKDEEAYKWTRFLVKEENLFLGISSGAVIAALDQIKSRIKKGSNIVLIFPDSGDRYLSVEGLYE